MVVPILAVTTGRNLMVRVSPVSNPETHGDGISNAEYTLAPGNVDRLPLTLMMGFPVHNLNSDLDFSSIQAAIDDPGTHDRDVIIVDSGTYHENVNITKRVTLREIIIL